MRTDGVEPPQHEAPRLQRGELTGCSASAYMHSKGGRPGSNRRRRGSQPRVLPLHHGHHEAGTTGLEPAASRLTSECSARLSYVPVECAGGIRTHGLELMRLARTTAPLPRSLAGRSRTCGLRRPKPAGWPLSPTARSEQRAPPAGFEPAASGLRARRHRRFDHRGRLRRQGSNLPLAVNSRASFRLDHAGTISGRRGSRTPKAQSEPTRFRDGIPRRWQSFRRWPRQASNLQPSA
jgi:hypothetical protein